MKFCQNLGKINTATYNMIKMDFGEDAMSRAQGFEWFHSFKEGQMSVESHAQLKAIQNAACCFLR
jgi:hypothetical protein